ncbi:MAG: hypothetical protein A2017_21295 [Lentisphaerae bacterium GWF2_44_16]|nr:MAG: hypothetical protein A2017_21295 [Lentisphaerae bacterium GWF2_44_16]
MPVKISSNSVVIENELFRRELAVDAGGLRTVSIFNKKSGREYVKRPDAAEFQLTLNATVIVSYSKPEVHELDGNMRDDGRLLKLENIDTKTSPSGSEIVKVSFLCPSFSAKIKACYEIYPDLPGCSKWLEVESLDKELRLHKVFFELLNACPGEFADAVFMKHGLVKAQPNFAANGDEDIVQVHNAVLNEGLFIGNGAPGILRYYMVYPHWPTGISCGYNMSSADFSKFLKKGEAFTTDKAYICLYEGNVSNTAGANIFREMIRRELPECKNNDGVMYCTWLPFLKNINEALLMELVERASAMGFRWFVVDDGWFTDNNWEMDSSKFPNGLKPIADKVHQSGMKFGLWLNIGSDYGQIGSRPEDNILDYHGSPKAFGFGAGKTTTRCFATEHRDIMAEKLISLAKEYGVDYFKLDFSNICSPYGIMSYGCTSREHKHHRDFSDSVTEQYLSMMQMRNAVKTQFTDLVIDFSFEAFGMEFPSIGALRYSELHHSSNMSTMKPETLKADKIRETLYQYCNLLPNERILGSLICLQNNRDVEHVLTAMVGTPLVAGDLRKISPDTVAQIKNISSTLKNLINENPLSEFQLLATGQKWDGYARYQKNGNGIICIFRNSFKEETVNISLDEIPAGTYVLRDILSDTDIAKYSGEEFRNGIKFKFSSASSCMALVFRKLK